MTCAGCLRFLRRSAFVLIAAATLTAGGTAMADHQSFSGQSCGVGIQRATYRSHSSQIGYRGSWAQRQFERGQCDGRSDGYDAGYYDGLYGRAYCDWPRRSLCGRSRYYKEGYECAYASAYRRGYERGSCGSHDRRHRRHRGHGHDW